MSRDAPLKLLIIFHFSIIHGYLALYDCHPTFFVTKAKLLPEDIINLKMEFTPKCRYYAVIASYICYVVTLSPKCCGTPGCTAILNEELWVESDAISPASSIISLLYMCCLEWQYIPVFLNLYTFEHVTMHFLLFRTTIHRVADATELELACRQHEKASRQIFQ